MQAASPACWHARQCSGRLMPHMAWARAARPMECPAFTRRCKCRRHMTRCVILCCCCEWDDNSAGYTECKASDCCEYTFPGAPQAHLSMNSLCPAGRLPNPARPSRAAHTRAAATGRAQPCTSVRHCSRVGVAGACYSAGCRRHACMSVDGQSLAAAGLRLAGKPAQCQFGLAPREADIAAK